MGAENSRKLAFRWDLAAGDAARTWGQRRRSRDANPSPRSKENALPPRKRSRRLLPLRTHVRSEGASACKALQPLRGAMESDEEVAPLTGASLSRLRCGEKAAPPPVPAALQRATAGNRVPGQDGTRGRRPKGTSSRSPFSSPAAAAHPIFHKSGHAKLPTSKISLRNKAGDCWIQLPPIFLGTKGFAIPAPRAQIKAGEVFTLPQGLFACSGGEAGAGCTGAALFARFSCRRESPPALRAPGCAASARVAAGMGLNAMPLGKHGSAQGRVAAKMNAGVLLRSAIRGRCGRCSRHTSAHFPCQRALCQAEAQTCSARAQEITTSPPARTAAGASLESAI